MATVPISTQHTLTATVTDLQNARFEGGLAISVTVSGANGSLLATRQTDINGRAIFTYTGLHAGLDQVTATLAFGGAAPAVAKVNWLPITIVTPTLQITRIVGTDGILNPKVVDLQGRPVSKQELH
ncbi:MAG: Ig-like domain-containing protein, partial [Caldilineaceae bacterium]|nr:Ig-like domain-containing protein [Caldilineaceae bacterium]